MLPNVYVNSDSCEAEIRRRLVSALRSERLLIQEGKSVQQAERLIDSELTSADLLRRLAEERLLSINPTNLDRACAEISDSVAGLRRARQGIVRRWGVGDSGAGYFALVDALRRRSEKLSGEAGASALLSRCEQLVCDGHPASPAAKTSLGIGKKWSDVLPEQTESIQLRFAAVNNARVHEVGLPTLEAIRSHLPRLASALASELERRRISGWSVIPVHPFQWERIIASEFNNEIANGEIILLDTTAFAEPLMSVRTLRVSDGKGAMHIKVAVEIQLTGAVRGISAGAVAAPVISEKISEVLELDSGFNPRSSDDKPGFVVARDIAAVRWDADSGLRAHCFGAVFREDPTADLEADDVAMPVATLLSRNPLSSRPILCDLFDELGNEPGVYEKWFRELGRLLFVPVAALLARWGIAVEPHPQNTVIVLRDGWPERIIVRDLGGCRVLEQGPIGRTSVGQQLRGTALVEDDPIRLVDKAFYPLVANLYRHLHLAANLPAPTRRRIDWGNSELLAEEYWRIRAALLESVEDGGENISEIVFRKFLGSEVPIKRVLGMRLSGAVTEQDYVYELNPLAAIELLDNKHFCQRIEPWLSWADETLRHRIEKSAAEEELSDDALVALQPDISNARENLALVRAQVSRRIGDWSGSFWELLRPLLSHEATAAADSFCISGHNVHPLAKLRRGFSTEESMLYGPESGGTVDLRFVAVDRGMVEMSKPGASGDFEQLLEQHFPKHIEAAKSYLDRAHVAGDYAIIPVHPWQLRHVITDVYEDEIVAGKIVVIPLLTLAARPTISLRTLIPHSLGALGCRPFLKCAVDVTLTSTRRSISQNSALGTPRVAEVVSEAVERLRQEVGLNPQVTVVPELAGVALARREEDTKTRQRGLSALIREDPSVYLNDGEIAVSASSLRGHCEEVQSPLADIAPGFFDDYVYDLVATVFGLMFFHGISLEQHLQNTMVKIDLSGEAPVYRGLLLRDFSGLRALASRLGAKSAQAFEKGSITLTDNYEEFLNKGFYACVFGNLDGIVQEFAKAQGIGEEALWHRVRVQVDRVISECRLPIPVQDLEWMGRPTMRRKGFLSMRLTETGADIYVDRANPLVAELVHE